MGSRNLRATLPPATRRRWSSLTSSRRTSAETKGRGHRSKRGALVVVAPAWDEVKVQKAACWPEFTKTVGNNPPLWRFFRWLMAMLLNFQGKCSLGRSFTRHVSGRKHQTSKPSMPNALGLKEQTRKGCEGSTYAMPAIGGLRKPGYSTNSWELPSTWCAWEPGSWKHHLLRPAPQYLQGSCV